MKPARVGELGREAPVLVDDGRYYDLSCVVADINVFACSADGLTRIAASVGSRT